MHIYSDPTFQMACDQFESIADYLRIPSDFRNRLMYPKRSIVVSVPVRMDDGSTQLLQGYRVQHTLFMGPTKGGTRFATSVTIGEVAALAMWMSWKCALAGLPSGVINRENAGKIRCRLLAEGANGATTVEADKILDERRDEVFVIPDILCNSGGVIVSYFEWVQSLQSFFWNETEVVDRLFRVLEQSFGAMIKRAKEEKISHRFAALPIGVERVMKAHNARGLFP
jgi:glutamate dehydrogenase/leucine dehydrogenase